MQQTYTHPNDIQKVIMEKDASHIYIYIQYMYNNWHVYKFLQIHLKSSLHFLLRQTWFLDAMADFLALPKGACTELVTSTIDTPHETTWTWDALDPMELNDLELEPEICDLIFQIYSQFCRVDIHDMLTFFNHFNRFDLGCWVGMTCCFRFGFGSLDDEWWGITGLWRSMMWWHVWHGQGWRCQNMINLSQLFPFLEKKHICFSKFEAFNVFFF